MAESALVESHISDAVALMKFLDARGEPLTSAFWHYYPEADQWRLLIAGPAFDKLLPKDEARAYGLVAEALAESHAASLTIGEVKPVRTDHTLVETVRKAIGTPPDAIARAHFRDTRVNGVFVKEMVVLRST